MQRESPQTRRRAVKGTSTSHPPACKGTPPDPTALVASPMDPSARSENVSGVTVSRLITIA